MLLKKTILGQQELRSRARVLSLRERGVLFAVDGRKTIGELEAALGAGSHTLIQKLLVAGYLESGDALLVESQVPKADIARAPVMDTGSFERAIETGGPGSRRSLAAVRMYLFDVCERMFARLPSMAQNFREMLRDARERESMLAVAEQMLVEIADRAGAERAETVRAKINELLPLQETEDSSI